MFLYLSDASSSWIFEDRFPRERATIRILFMDYLFPYSGGVELGRAADSLAENGFHSPDFVPRSGGSFGWNPLDQLTAEIDPGIECGMEGNAGAGASRGGFPSYPFADISSLVLRSSRCNWMFFAARHFYP